MENEGRWFLIEHKECGSVVTVNSQKFLNSVNSNNFSDQGGIICPNCLAPFHKKDSLRRFFEEYEKLIKILNEAGFNIREIKAKIDFQDSKIGLEAKS